MPKAKPYSGPVDDQIAVQLLNSTGEHRTVGGEELLLGHALQQAAHQLREIVEKANDLLEGNEFAGMVAENLAAKMNRRGHALIAVADDGTVELHISYEDQPPRRPGSHRDQKLPLLQDLRDKAAELGVDIEEFGIKRKKIWEHLCAVEAGEIKGKPTKKTRGKPKPKSKSKAKAAPEAEIRVAEDDAEDDPGPMSAGPDETKVSPAPDDVRPPRRRAIVKNDEAGPVVVGAGGGQKGSNSLESQEGPDMRQLVKDSQEVSIADLLQSDPPKQ